MGTKLDGWLVAAAVGAAVMMGGPNAAHAWPSWGTPASETDGGSGTQCAGCHGDFNEGTTDDLHTMHTANIDSCTTCHMSTGDDPDLGASGQDTFGDSPGESCAGCHGRDYGGTSESAGLRLFHETTVGATCLTCHSGDPTPVGEDVLPVNYGGTGTTVEDSCNPAGTEDWDADGTGLDNDGDGLRDENDPDCLVMVDAGVDAGLPDAGLVDAGTDAGTEPDAGAGADAGTDSGTPDEDAGITPEEDAGTEADAGPDAGMDGGDGDGCGCVTAGRGGQNNAAGALLLMAGVGVLAMRRRRRG